MDHNKIITFFIQKCPWILAYMLRKKKYFNLKTEGKFFKLLLLFVKRRFPGKFGQHHTFPSEDSSTNLTGQFSKADQVSFSANQSLKFLFKENHKIFCINGLAFISI